MISSFFLIFMIKLKKEGETKMETKYKRVLIKLSGEVLAGENHTGIKEEVISNLCEKIKEVVNMGVEVAIVVGGGNFWRGRNGEEIKRATADYMGMLATAMNALALEDALEAKNIKASILSAIPIMGIAEEFNIKKVEAYLKENRVVIFSCGTGHPYFTTDTAAVLRAIEIEADIILLGKNIDAIYSSDPKIDVSAKRYEEITYLEVLKNDLKVMDSTATAMCKDNNMPLLVFGIKEPSNIIKAVKGEKIGTIVHN